MRYVVFDTQESRLQLLPITYTRPVGDIRIGILTMKERWQHFLQGTYYYSTAEHLRELFPQPTSIGANTIFLAGNVIATAQLAAAVSALRPGERLFSGSLEIARRGATTDGPIVEFPDEVLALNHIYDIFLLNDRAIAIDFDILTAGRSSQPIDPSNTVLGDPSQVFIEPGATVECASLNTRQGPIYIGPEAVVMEGCNLRGPIALCEHAQTNMGCRIYGATTLGPYCKVGGELNNVVMIGFSNKGHDGFLGNAVIGEWCNLGGGTTASNLKNDYSEIKLWNYQAGRFLRTGLQFCGLIMGDHSKSAINTTFNTATTVGVGCNIISEGMPRVFIPSFSKGGTSGFENVNLSEFFAIARRVMARRHRELTDAHCRLFQAIADFSDNFK